MRMRAALLAVVIAVLLLASRPQAMILLTATTEILELTTGAAVNTDYTVAYADHTASAFTPGSTQGTISTATTTTIVSAPAASTQRQIKLITIVNRGTTAQTVRLQKDVSATEYQIIPTTTLGASERMVIDDYGQITVYDANGRRKQQATDTSGYTGRSFAWQKAATAKDAAGYWYASAKDAGFPGAYSLGTPGLNGTVTDCSASTGAGGAAALGTHVLQDPSSGSLYLTNASIVDSVAEVVHLIDVLWFNTGLAVTTTTGQAITFPTLPARDLNGSTNGEGVMAALLTTTANTNAGTIATTTLTYTDSDGNSPNTATFSAQVGWQAPVTPVIGTWLPFRLAAGDRGIRSVETVTLGTSYGGGALSLVVYRPLVAIPNPVAAVGGLMAAQQFFTPPGVRLYNDTCVWALQVGSASAGTLSGTYMVMER